ncbi:MAG: hypothetical protein WCO33_02385 [bacterium]
MEILKRFSIKNVNDKLISFSIFASKVLVVWFIFNLLVPIFQLVFTQSGRDLLRQSDQNALVGIAINVVSIIVLNAAQALVFYGYSQIASWILKLKNGDEKSMNKEETSKVKEKVSEQIVDVKTEVKKNKKNR